ncbi:unannotated protein [freshwater metagenome]|uniref:Unannotated protein n=1 Tax=freshwater metagenome TaxID=449393 RepID=A0A6J6B373_9ZZZZ|nr:NADH-quinone oxidoreductase subunit NuoK [Actinomycetota bacterium]MSY79476.1 NADH-quinone oxidoreductase subunit NuoK [Actinomycetota bacterium]MTA63219.1 NADH-quinone oxidoreductase subunit NuoK [Actinomycetota bacterium]
MLALNETWYLVLAAMIFTIGSLGLLTRKNPLVMFMCVELMLNAVNLTFVTFSKALDDIAGQAIVFFVMVVAAAEVVVGLGIIVAIMRRRQSANADDVSLMRG